MTIERISCLSLSLLCSHSISLSFNGLSGGRGRLRRMAHSLSIHPSRLRDVPSLSLSVLIQSSHENLLWITHHLSSLFCRILPKKKSNLRTEKEEKTAVLCQKILIYFQKLFRRCWLFNGTSLSLMNCSLPLEVWFHSKTTTSNLFCITWAIAESLSRRHGTKVAIYATTGMTRRDNKK